MARSDISGKMGIMTLERDPHAHFQGFSHPERFVSPAWLASRLGTKGLKVIEADEDLMLYSLGHLHGAIRINCQQELCDPITRDFIDGEAFSALMSAKGIEREDTVVIYGDHSNRWAAFAFFVFELFGHPDVRLLDGGRDAWIAEERSTTFMVPDYPRSEYPVVERDDSLRAFVDDIRANLDSDNTIIDVRSPEAYAGDTCSETAIAQRSGHIPGAINRYWRQTMHHNARIKSREEIEELFSGVDLETPSIVYCALGDAAAHLWIVLRYCLGAKEVRNYDGSWAEWGNMVRVPISRNTQ